MAHLSLLRGLRLLLLVREDGVLIRLVLQAAGLVVLLLHLLGPADLFSAKTSFHIT